MTRAPRTKNEQIPKDGAVSAPTPAAVSQRFHLLVAIANFADLRRRVGCARAEGIASIAAARISRLLPDASVAIIGRDQLACTFLDDDPAAIDMRTAAIAAGFREPFLIGDASVLFSLDFGAASAPASHIDEVALVEAAEAALARTRLSRNLAPSALPAELIALGDEFKRAIACDELILHYQPKVHVRRQEITSAEALVRWRHPTRGLVMPNDFIAAAEQCNLIGAMTLWTIRRAIADQRDLVSRGHDLRLFINISGQLLADDAFVREACVLVGDSDARLGFEITETSVIRDPASAIANLQIFADFGIVISIDDYGAGLSSLAYLKQLPARELKIDKLFVTQLTSSNRDPLIVRSTIDLAHALEMEVVAEGVETHAALALLTVMGCDMVQGFLLSRPVPLDALVQYMDDGLHRLVRPQPLAAFGGLQVQRR